MIQRKQTIYYLIAILALLIPLFGMDIMTMSNEAVTHHVTFMGTSSETIADGAVIELNPPQLPLYIGIVVLVILLLLTMVLYKSLRLQLRLGRFALGLYALMIIGLAVVIYYINMFMTVAKLDVEIGIGSYIFAAGILFVWLGNRGVLKDKRLIDSVDRIR